MKLVETKFFHKAQFLCKTYCYCSLYVYASSSDIIMFIEMETSKLSKQVKIDNFIVIVTYILVYVCLYFIDVILRTDLR